MEKLLLDATQQAIYIMQASEITCSQHFKFNQHRDKNNSHRLLCAVFRLSEEKCIGLSWTLRWKKTFARKGARVCDSTWTLPAGDVKWRRMEMWSFLLLLSVWWVGDDSCEHAFSMYEIFKRSGFLGKMKFDDLFSSSDFVWCDGKCNFRINSSKKFTRHDMRDEFSFFPSLSSRGLGSNYIATAVDVILLLSMSFIFCRCANW